MTFKKKNKKHDIFIEANYEALGPTKIAKRLGIPKGSVITRYGIITGRRARTAAYGEPAKSRPVPSLPKISMDR